MTPALKTFISAAAVSMLTMAPGLGSAAGIGATTADALQRYGYDVTAMDLSTQTVAEAVAILESDDNEATKKARLDVLLGTTGPATLGLSLEGNVEQGELVATALREYGYEVDPASLDAAEIAALNAAIESDDNTRTKMAAIDRVLADGEADFTAVDGDSMLRQAVADDLRALGIEADAAALTEAQVVELKLLFSSEASQNEKLRRAEEIVVG